jgi:hypothetical protein
LPGAGGREEWKVTANRCRVSFRNDKNCISQSLITIKKKLRKSTLKERRFILAHNFKGFSSWLNSLLLLVLQGNTSWGEHMTIHLMPVRKWRGI